MCIVTRSASRQSVTRTGTLRRKSVTQDVTPATFSARRSQSVPGALLRMLGTAFPASQFASTQPILNAGRDNPAPRPSLSSSREIVQVVRTVRRDAVAVVRRATQHGRGPGAVPMPSRSRPTRPGSAHERAATVPAMVPGPCHRACLSRPMPLSLPRRRSKSVSKAFPTRSCRRCMPPVGNSKREFRVTRA